MAAGQNRLKLLLKIDASLNNNHPMENYIRLHWETNLAFPVAT